MNDHCDCDHEWRLEDNSFDHELGVEVIHVWICEKCGEVTTKEPEVFL